MQKINWNSHTLSKLCLGTVQFGLDYGIANTTGKLPQEKINKILDYVISEDINCFDTAQVYGNSESVLGAYFKMSKFPDNEKVVSKIESELFDLVYEEFAEKIKMSVANVAKKQLFGLLVRNCYLPLNSWHDGPAEYVRRLKSDKLVEYIGVSVYTDAEFKLAVENDDIDMIQIPFNLLDQRAIYNNWLTEAKEKGKLLFVRSVYLQGLLLMDSADIPANLAGVKPFLGIIDKVCNDLKISINELALAFVNSIANESIVLFGCDNLEQAKENIYNFNNIIKLDQKTINYLIRNLSGVCENIYNPTKWKK